MDKLGINKEEMHRPLKHIIINQKGKVVLLDFERCYLTEKPHNVTQFGDFLLRRQLINTTGVNASKIKECLSEYKRKRTRAVFEAVLELI